MTTNSTREAKPRHKGPVPKGPVHGEPTAAFCTCDLFWVNWCPSCSPDTYSRYGATHRKETR